MVKSFDKKRSRNVTSFLLEGTGPPLYSGSSPVITFIFRFCSRFAMGRKSTRLTRGIKKDRSLAPSSSVKMALVIPRRKVSAHLDDSKRVAVLHCITFVQV